MKAIQQNLETLHHNSANKKGSATRPLLITVLVLGAMTLVPYCILILLNPALRAVENIIDTPGRVLLVTAHPDDETVFFAPTVTALRNAKHDVFLLCLTTGKHWSFERAVCSTNSCTVEQDLSIFCYS